MEKNYTPTGPTKDSANYQSVEMNNELQKRKKLLKQAIWATSALLACLLLVLSFGNLFGKSSSEPQVSTVSVAQIEETKPVATSSETQAESPKPSERPKTTKPPCSIHSWPETSSGGTMICNQCGATATRKENIFLKKSESGPRKKDLAYIAYKNGKLQGDLYDLGISMNVVKMGITVEFDEIVTGNPDGEWKLLETYYGWAELGQIPYQSTGSITLELSFDEPKECMKFFLLPPTSNIEGYYSLAIDYMYIGDE